MTEGADGARDGPFPDYPVVLTVVGLNCLVVGGGPVASRRVRGLLESGARVTVIAPDIDGSVTALGVEPPGHGPQPDLPQGCAGRLTIESRPYRTGEAAGYELVVTATGDPLVDRTVVADAVAAGVPVASADRGTPGTIRLPAVHRDGPVTIAISTGGASPALARWLRRRIAASLGPDMTTLAALLDEARGDLQASGRPTGSVDWMALLDDQVVPLVDAGRIEEARALLRRITGAAPPG
jgi:precorrin-2 dehydrogenase/sirohydrochlorin ferrochelatase